MMSWCLSRFKQNTHVQLWTLSGSAFTARSRVRRMFTQLDPGHVRWSSTTAGTVWSVLRCRNSSSVGPGAGNSFANQRFSLTPFWAFWEESMGQLVQEIKAFTKSQVQYSSVLFAAERGAWSKFDRDSDRFFKKEVDCSMIATSSASPSLSRQMLHARPEDIVLSGMAPKEVPRSSKIQLVPVYPSLLDS